MIDRTAYRSDRMVTSDGQGRHTAEHAGPYPGRVFEDSDLKVLYLSSFRRMSDGARETMLRAACQYKPFAKAMQRARVTLIPPMVAREVTRPHGWRLVAMMAEMINADVSRRTSHRISPEGVTLNDLLEACTLAATRWQHPQAAAIWLVGVLGQFGGHAATLFAEGLLRSEQSPYHAPSIEQMASPWGVDTGPWLGQLATAPVEHPAAGLPAEYVASLLVADLDDEHGTVLWLTGVAPAGDRSPSPAPTDPDPADPGSVTPENEQGSEAEDQAGEPEPGPPAASAQALTGPDQARAAHALAALAADRLAEALASGRFGRPEDLAAITELHELVDAAGPVETLDELVAQMSSADPEAALLERLAEVDGGAEAAAHAEAVRRHCRDALNDEDLQWRPGLVTFAELLAAETTPGLAELYPLLDELPSDLHAAVFATGRGLLTLPDEPTGDVTDAPEPSPRGEEPLPEPAEPDDADQQDAADDIAADEPGGGDDAGQPELGTPADEGSDGQDEEPAEPAASDVAPDVTPDAAADADPSTDDQVSGAEPPAAAIETAAEGGAEEDDPAEAAGEPDLPTDEEVDELLATLVAQGEVASAYWVATTFESGQARSSAFEMLALARQMRREGGPVGLAFDKAATALPAQDLLSDRTARIMAVTAGLAATFVAPYTAVSFLNNISGAFESNPNLHRLLQAVTDAARVGVRLGAAPGGAPDDSRQVELVRLRAQAGELLEVGPDRGTSYQPASRIWQRWIDPNNGWLGQLLVAVRDDDRTDMGKLRASRAKVGDDRDLVAMIAATDREERGSNARPIEYHGRDALLRRVRTHLEVVDDWFDATDRSDEAEQDRNSWEERVSVELRQTLESCGPAALEELGNVGDDELAQAAAGFAGQLLQRLFDAMIKGRAPAGREPNPEMWRARPLLHTDVPMDPHGWTPMRPLTFDDLQPLADPPAWAVSFQRRLDRGDLDEAEGIAAVIAAGDPSRREALTTQIDEAVESAQRVAADRWLEVRDVLATAKRQGLLDADEAVLLDQRLADLDVTGAGGSVPEGVVTGRSQVRTDVGQVLRQLRQLERDLGEARDARINAELARIDEAIANTPRLAGAAEKLRTLIADGKLAEAEELRLLSEQDESLTTPSEPEWFRPQLLATLTEPSAVTDELIEAALAGAQYGPFDYRALDETGRDRAQRTLDALRTILDASRPQSSDLVRSILLRLGLDVPRGGVQPGEHRGGRHRWFDAQVVSRGAPVRQFGTSMGQRIRVLVTPAKIAPAQVVELVESDAGGATTLLLHTGAADLTWRQELAEGLRSSSATPVLPYDAHLLAARVSEPTESWAVTCGLALPYANANPYLFNVHGLTLPTEAFFGRRAELRQLLDPLGATIVFGGRQLGKTALLKQAAVAFNSYDEPATVVLRSIKPVGIDGDPSPLWGVLRGLLTDEGIKVDRAPAREERETVVRAVRRWLDEDDRHRLMVLLDEADAFLAADAPHYSNVETLKDLVATDPRRLKVVFAGLHDVTRFQRDANHPFVHLGDPIGIGGLDPEDALSLLRVPLRALGFSADEDVLLRAVTFANYHPAILQMFGSALVDRLQSQSRPTAPGWEVTTEDVDAVFNDSGFAQHVTSLLLNTLKLDSRYGVLAYAMAHADREQDADRPVARTVSQIQAECAAHDELAEFGRSDREGEIAGLLDELELLGIARKRPGNRWELRSRYVARMLGDDDLQLVNQLLTFAQTSNQYTYDASKYRRPFGSGPVRVSPLADRDLVALATQPSAAQAVIGSRTLEIDDVGDVLSDDVDARGHGTGIVMARVELGQRSSRRPPHATKQTHRVVVSDLRSKTSRQAQRALEQAAAWRDDVQIPGSTGVAVLLDTTHQATVRQLLDDEDPSVDLVALRRLDADTIAQWARVAEIDPADAALVAQITGGWPALLNEVAERSHDTGTSLADAAEALRERFESREFAEEFLAACGVGELDTTATQAFELLRTYGPLSVAEYEQALVGELAGERGHDTVRHLARRERRLLGMFGFVDDDGETLAVEPVLSAAFERVHG